MNFFSPYILPHVWNVMNPIVIIGIMAMTVSAGIMMISFSNDQIRYSELSGQISEMQQQRISEEIAVTASGDGLLEIKNTGHLPVQIKEIRVLNEQGHVIFRQKTDSTVLASNTITLDADPAIERVIAAANGLEKR